MSSLLVQGLYASALSTFHWLYIVILGVTAKKLGFVDSKFKSGLSKVVTNIILPCFVFSQIVNNFRISQYILIFQAVVGCIVIYIFGLFVGFAIGRILGLNKKQRDFLGAVFSTPHNTSIYVILIQVIGPFLDTIFPRNPNMVGDSEKRGLLYVVINSIVANIWKWSCCYVLIEPEDEEDDLDSSINSPLLKDNDEQKENQIVEKKPKYKEKTFKDILKSVCNMPLIASIFSLCITLSPSFQRLFITPKSIADNVHFPGEEVKKIGRNFLNTSILFWLSIVKLIIMPILTTPVIIYIFRNIFHSDDVLTFNYLFLGAAPPAINIIVICAYKNAFVNEISSIMIVMYTAAIITLTANITGFLYILGMLNAPIIAAQNMATIHTPIA